MPARPRPLPQEFSDGPFRVTAALANGIAPDRLRRDDLIVPTRGVRVPIADADDPWSRLEAIALLLRPDQVFSHVTAAWIWGCPLPGRLARAPRIHVTTIGDGPVMRRREVIGHHVAADRSGVAMRSGLRTSTPAAFWYESRAMLDRRELVVLGDHIIGVGGLATVESLTRAVHPGDRAVRQVRDALSLIRPGSESPMESVVRVIVVDAGFPEPALNVDVHDRSGRFIGRVDMAWVALRIAIEYDGDHHRTDRETFRHDRRRANGFTVEHWLVIHVTSIDIGDTAPFLRRLSDAFAARTRQRPWR